MNNKWKFLIGIFVVVFLYLTTSFFISNKNEIIQSEATLPIAHAPSRPSISAPSINIPSSPVALEPVVDLDKLLGEMELGNIAYNAPTNINIDDTPQIELLISFTDTVEQLKDSIIKEGEKRGVTIKVSNRVNAHLSGKMFDITPITPEEQATSKSQQTQWLWEIDPKEVGKYKLYLTITALVEIDGKTTNRAIDKPFEDIIEVDITNSQRLNIFWDNNWQWIIATFFSICIAIWTLYKYFKKPVSNPSHSNI